jgi:enamine deaminase RidA (YjgF/YER057c/UK114 family)
MLAQEHGLLSKRYFKPQRYSSMAQIKRIGTSLYSPTRSRIVIHNGVVTTVAVARNNSPSLYEQSRAALAIVDRHLAEAGTDKSRILMVMIYVTDIANKSEFNRAWDGSTARTSLCAPVWVLTWRARTWSSLW